MDKDEIIEKMAEAIGFAKNGHRDAADKHFYYGEAEAAYEAAGIDGLVKKYRPAYVVREDGSVVEHDYDKLQSLVRELGYVIGWAEKQVAGMFTGYDTTMPQLMKRRLEFTKNELSSSLAKIPEELRG